MNFTVLSSFARLYLGVTILQTPGHLGFHYFQAPVSATTLQTSGNLISHYFQTPEMEISKSQKNRRKYDRPPLLNLLTIFDDLLLLRSRALSFLTRAWTRDTASPN